jgi:hypothetical protein
MDVCVEDLWISVKKLLELTKKDTFLKIFTTVSSLSYTVVNWQSKKRCTTLMENWFRHIKKQIFRQIKCQNNKLKIKESIGVNTKETMKIPLKRKLNMTGNSLKYSCLMLTIKSRHKVTTSKFSIKQETCNRVVNSIMF